MRVVFLDIDGVICTHKSRFTYNRITALDKTNCDLLLKWVKKDDLKIVIHSSWRLYHNGIEVFKEELKKAGVPELIDYIYDVCEPKIRSKNDAIKYWIQKNSVDDFVIIDDDAIIHDEELNNKYIKIMNDDVGIDPYNTLYFERKTFRNELENL